MKTIIKIFKSPKFMSGYMAITIAFVLYYIHTIWKDIPHILAFSKIDYVLYAFIFGCLNYMGYGYVANVLYKKLGAKISYWKTLQIILASRLGIYLPGKIWYASNFYLFSRKLNIPPSIIAQSFGLTNVFLFITGGICSLPIVLPLLSYWGRWLLIVIIGMLIIFSHPKSIKYVISFFPKIHTVLKDQIYFSTFGSNLYLKFLFLFFLLWIIAGVRLSFCVMTFHPVQYSDFLTIITASAASLILGMLAVFAPGGIGIREGVGVFILSTIIPIETAFFVMILSRLLSAITDLGSGLFAFYLLNKMDRRMSSKKINIYELKT